MKQSGWRNRDSIPNSNLFSILIVSYHLSQINEIFTKYTNMQVCGAPSANIANVKLKHTV